MSKFSFPPPSAEGHRSRFGSFQGSAWFENLIKFAHEPSSCFET